ncbi:hypothetical protein ACVNF4_20415 [Streptomyces sp. S6]
MRTHHKVTTAVCALLVAGAGVGYAAADDEPPEYTWKVPDLPDGGGLLPDFPPETPAAPG